MVPPFLTKLKSIKFYIMRNFLLVLTAAVVFAACKKDSASSLSLNETKVALHYDEEFQFEVTKGGDVIPFSALTSSSSDENVGDLSNSGLFVANRIGTTTITISGEGGKVTAEVTVEPYHELFEEPVLEFGASKEAVKGKESRSLAAEIESSLLYEGE